MPKIRLYALVALLLLPVTSALAQNHQAGSLTIRDAWARPTAGQTPNGAAYMTITNKGQIPDRLLSVESAASAKTELHTTVAEGTVMRMRPVPSIDVGPGETVALKPGGLHVMLVGLKAPLAAGRKLSLLMTFEKAGTTNVEVTVRRGAPPADSDATSHAPHKTH